jgi:hypothetical protein
VEAGHLNSLEGNLFSHVSTRKSDPVLAERIASRAVRGSISVTGPCDRFGLRSGLPTILGRAKDHF